MTPSVIKLTWSSCRGHLKQESLVLNCLPDGGAYGVLVKSYFKRILFSIQYAFNSLKFFIKELIPHIEKTYKVKAEKRFRGIAGLSMGGYGSLLYALKYPNLFAASAPLSAAVWSDNDVINMNESMFNRLFSTSMGSNLKGKDRLTNAWINNSPLAIIEKKTKEELSAVKYWIDCGDDDFLTIGNAQLHIALTSKNVPHEFRMTDGAHNWTYWRTGIIDALSFIGDSFHQK